MNNEKLAKASLGLSVAAAVASATTSLLGIDLWFAGTQWMLVAIIFAVWTLVLKK